MKLHHRQTGHPADIAARNAEIVKNTVVELFEFGNCPPIATSARERGEKGGQKHD